MPTLVVPMTQLFHVETVSAPFLPYGADILDLSLSYGAGSMTLTAFAGSNSSARLVNFDISDTANFLNQSFLGASTDGFESADERVGPLRKRNVAAARGDRGR